MIFYGTFRTEKKLTDTPMIDYIEFEFPKVPRKYCPEDLDPTGVELSCDWDSSDWHYDGRIGEGCFRCKGVYVNQEYANGNLDMFRDARITYIQVCAPDDSGFELSSLDIADGENRMSVAKEYLEPFCTLYAY